MSLSRYGVEVVISGTGLYHPPGFITNEELVESFNHYVDDHNRAHAAAIAAGKMPKLEYSSAEFILKASGIQRRYVVDKEGILNPDIMRPILPKREMEQLGVQAEMSVHAAIMALAAAGKNASEVDAVILSCSNFERPYPAVAIEVQKALGAGGFAFDMNVACSSATFALAMAQHLIQGQGARTVLLLNPEICTAHLNFRDRDSHFIFGDACTAMVLESAQTCKKQGAFKILGTHLQTHYSNNIRNNQGFLTRSFHPASTPAELLFMQQGRKVFKEVVPLVAAHITSHLQQLQLSPPDMRRYWLHQANLSMNEFIFRKVMERDPREWESPVVLDEFANTSSAGSIIAFHRYNEDMRPGDKGIICSFGAGYSVGSVIVEKQ